MGERSEMATLITVLRSGGEYKVEHVAKLKAQAEHFGFGGEFICLSDCHSAPGYRELKHGWPGWWSKMEAFKIHGPAVYVDLDTWFTGSLGPLFEAAQSYPFIALRDFNPKQRLLGTGLMAWCGNLSEIYHHFRQYPRFHMEQNRNPRWWGDQGFMERYITKTSSPIAFWQEVLPGAVVSFKKHCQNGVPEDARVVCFHGKPKPWEVAA